MDTDGPVLVEFVVRKHENVYPMVTVGSTIDEMLMGDEVDEADEAHYISSCE
ncbi:acetolactate synthase 3 catalytic subunit [compost metagenome]